MKKIYVLLGNDQTDGGLFDSEEKVIKECLKNPDDYIYRLMFLNERLPEELVIIDRNEEVIPCPSYEERLEVEWIKNYTGNFITKEWYENVFLKN